MVATQIFNETSLLIHLSLYRLILVAAMITHKFYSDEFYSNQYISFVGGVSQKELNFLEREFLEIIEYKVMVTQEEYDVFLMRLNSFILSHLNLQ